MKTLILLCLLGVLNALELSKVMEPIANEYIVLFKNNISSNIREAHMNTLNGTAEIFKRYDFPGFSGYAAVVTEERTLQSILDSPLVELVEQNGVVRISDEPVKPLACDTQIGATWGLVRSATEDLRLTGEYKYDQGVGEGIVGYILDTGIYTEHNDFEGRAIWGYNAVGDGRNSDYNGHGTHVAGTMCGKLYGLAKKSTCKAVKVLNDGGSGSYAGVIDGIDWMVKDAISNIKRASKAAAKAVGNMSLGGGKSDAVNSAVNAAHDAEVIMAVAGGNDARDACNYSPASAEKSICAGASSNVDAMASFSNYGSCVDIFGPGVSITSAWINGVNSDNTISGTSMASPHVAGVAMKLMWEYQDYDADKIKDEMLSIATQNKLSGVRGSPNKLTFHGCID